MASVIEKPLAGGRLVNFSWTTSSTVVLQNTEPRVLFSVVVIAVRDAMLLTRVFSFFC